MKNNELKILNIKKRFFENLKAQFEIFEKLSDEELLILRKSYGKRLKNLKNKNDFFNSWIEKDTKGIGLYTICASLGLAFGPLFYHNYIEVAPEIMALAVGVFAIGNELGIKLFSNLAKYVTVKNNRPKINKLSSNIVNINKVMENRNSLFVTTESQLTEQKIEKIKQKINAKKFNSMSYLTQKIEKTNEDQIPDEELFEETAIVLN